MKVEHALNISSVGRAKRWFRKDEPKLITTDGYYGGTPTGRGMILIAISDGASVPIYFDYANEPIPAEARNFDDWIAIKPKDVIEALGELS